MEESTKLIPRDQLEKTIAGLLEKERAVADCISRILPSVDVPEIRKDLEKKLSTALAHIGPLSAGYIPIDNVWFINVESRSRWRKHEVEAVLKTMPEEIKEAWDKAKELGIFETYNVSARGGDPILAGKVKGSRTNFFIGSWLSLRGGYSVGVRCLPQVTDERI